jgi:general secretion pathway protein L
MTKTMIHNLFPSRQRDTGGARLDVLLPSGWPDTTAAIVWRYRSAAGETRVNRGALEELPAAPSAKLYVWTPASETLLTTANIPTRSREKVNQALPFALEDQLLDDPQNLHFAWRRDHDGTLLVGVTNKEHLRAWLAALRTHGLEPRAVAPATLAVPWSPNSWSAAFVENEILVRTGPVGGFACGASTEPSAVIVANLKEAQQQSRMPEYFIMFDPPSGFSADEWSAALGVPVRVEMQSMWDAPGDSEPALNLLQGEFALTGDFHQSLRPWLPAAIMVGIWLIGTVSFDVYEWWRLSSQHRANTNEMTSILLEAFPDTKVITDSPLLQMRQGIDLLQARGGLRANDVLPLLITVLPTLQSHSQVRLQGVEYRDRSMTLTVTTTDPAGLDTFRQALQNNSLNAEVTESENSETGGIKGRIRVEPLAAPKTS